MPSSQSTKTLIDDIYNTHEKTAFKQVKIIPSGMQVVFNNGLCLTTTLSSDSISDYNDKIQKAFSESTEPGELSRKDLNKLLPDEIISDKDKDKKTVRLTISDIRTKKLITSEILDADILESPSLLDWFVALNFCQRV